MYMLINIIPEWLINASILVGVAGLLGSLFLSVVPFIKQWALPIKIVSLFLLVSGIWFNGAIYTKNYYEQQAAELRIQLLELETRQEKVNTQIVTQIVTKERLIKEKGDVIVTEIEKNRDNINAECKLSDSAWMLYNSSVTGEIPGSTNTTDGAAAKVKNTP